MEARSFGARRSAAFAAKELQFLSSTALGHIDLHRMTSSQLEHRVFTEASDMPLPYR